MELSRQTDFYRKNAHVIGMGRSGLAAAEVLVSLGARVVIHDVKDEAELATQLTVVRELGCETRMGIEAYQDIATADFVVTSPGVPETCPGIVAACENGVPVFSEIELAYRISPAPIIAVTGTNGKTTTTALIGEALKRDGRHVYIAGNIVAGKLRLPLVRAAFRATPSDVIVAEVSSFQLEWVTSFRPRIAALLNIAGDHLDRYFDLEAYIRAKARIFEHQTSSDSVVLNADAPLVMDLVPTIKAQIWLFSRIREVERGVFARNGEVWVKTSEGEEFVCNTLRTKLRGTHNLENILAAAAAALAFGASRHAVQEAVDTIEPLEHRMEPVMEIRGVEFINNSMCTNVSAAIRSLEAVGRPAIVISGGKDKGADYGPLGEAFKRWAKYVVLIGADAPLLERAAHRAGFTAISYAQTLQEAVEESWRHAQAGDAIILSPACASFDMFDDFEHRGRVFKEAVAKLAEQLEVLG